MPGAEIDRRNFRRYDADQGKNGLYGPTARGWFVAATVVTNTVHRFHRVFPTRNMTIVSLGHVVSVPATNDDSVDMGLYSAAGAKIISTGLTAGKCNVGGAQSIAITPTTLQAGTAYYFGHKYGTIGGTAATVLFASFASVSTTRAFGLTAGNMDGVDVTGAAAGDALPANMTFALNSAAVFPMGLLLES